MIISNMISMAVGLTRCYIRQRVLAYSVVHSMGALCTRTVLYLKKLFQKD